MDLRGGFRPPLMRPGFLPVRGRGPPMDRLRVLPPRPPLMRGLPAFGGRPMPPGRPRVLPPGMLPRPPIPPPGALVPPGARGLLPPPRPMMGGPLPPRPLHPDIVDGYMPTLPLNNFNKDGNGLPNKMNQNQDIDLHSGNRDMRNNRIIRNHQTIIPQGGGPGLKKNRKDIKNRRIQPSSIVRPPQNPQVPIQNTVQTQHHPVQNVHPNMHQIAPGPTPLPPPQNSVHIKQPPTPNHVQPMQSQFVPSQSGPVPHQNPIRAGSIPHRRGGGTHMGNRANVPMNYPPNAPHQMPPRANTMMNGPQPVVPYSNAPPPSYPVPPPQVPIKRPAPPPVNPPHQAMPPPKRVRYETPTPSNGYPAPYQQLPSHQQSSYSMNYEMPPPTSTPAQQPTDMYGNMTAPSNTNIIPTQNYNSSTDYGNYQVTPTTSHAYNTNGNTQYSNPSYATNPSYSNSYSSGSYDSGVDYTSTMSQSMSTADPYAGYSKPVSTVDSYGYNNSSYSAPTSYDDYSSGYTDNSGYTQSVPDQNYSLQSANTYTSYSY